MLKFESWKKLLVLLVTALGIAYAAPNLLPGEGGSGGILPGQKINLGLDLQGGSHLLLRVDMNAVASERLESVAETIRQEFRASKIRFSGLDVEDGRVNVTLRDAADAATAKEIFAEFGRSFDVIDQSPVYRIGFNEPGLAELQTQTLEQSMEIIRRRIDPDGTKEPIIQRQGTERILVQLPGVDDPEEVKRLLGRTAKLTFQLVDMTMTPQEHDRGRTPPGSVLLPDDKEEGRFYVVEKRVMVSGELLDTAQASFDQNNRPAVSFTLNATGAKRFGRVTGANIGRPFAIILDGKVVSAPTIQSQIFGNGQITGSFTVAETNELALILRAGALPAPLIVMEERRLARPWRGFSRRRQIAALVGRRLSLST